MNITEKQVGAILYMYYINKDCEDDFSFDNGESTSKIKTYYDQIDDEIKEQVENNIRVTEDEGTDYEYLVYTYRDMPNLYLQVTSMYDFDGEPAKEGYTGSAWADVGMFFVDSGDCDFDDLAE